MVVYTGKTIKEAIQVASRSLHKPEKELKVEIIDQPRKGFLGIGRRPAKIEATVKPPVVKKAATTVKAPVIKKPKKDVSMQAPVAKEVDVPTNDGKQGSDQDPAVIAARHEANLRHTRNTGQQLTVYLKKVFSTLGIETKPEISKVAAHAITIDIKTVQSGKVIGHHGRRINAMEQISAAFMNYHGAPKTAVILDTSNYRQRRQAALHEIAERAVTEVVASGQAVYLDPMPARERKQLHRELEDNDHVRTYSHGRDPYRSVVIAPKD
ncbi:MULTISPECIES: RNA-binding cell elongation regulator Jag/EloR [Limosilactobacillus]|uniref:RNA-binding protein KhpB n=1 Tax=Limosilactobacillus panis DSM 6035 TaxID=1423782 RepID=A0A0R1XDN4_9LACO|nr:RNA-binding cell elongation regulator Jag/EloR [Limosilactobacillus panis]KRM28282.1 r3h domain protein [Limosilactobacillus panis DSM 6035]